MMKKNKVRRNSNIIKVIFQKYNQWKTGTQSLVTVSDCNCWLYFSVRVKCLFCLACCISCSVMLSPKCTPHVWTVIISCVEFCHVSYRDWSIMTVVRTLLYCHFTGLQCLLLVYLSLSNYRTSMFVTGYLSMWN